MLFDRGVCTSRFGSQWRCGIASLIHEDLDNQVGVHLSIEANVVQFAEECLSASPDAATVHFSWDGGLSWEEEPLRSQRERLKGKSRSIWIVVWCSTMWSWKTLMAIVQRFLQTVIVIHLPFTLVNSKKCIAMISKPTMVGLPMLYLPEKTEKVRMTGNGESQLGLGGDPDFAASGDYVWGNDLGGEVNGQQYNGEYQNSKHNQLLSPSFDVSDYEEIVLTYDRWLSVEDGSTIRRPLR